MHDFHHDESDNVRHYIGHHHDEQSISQVPQIRRLHIVEHGHKYADRQNDGHDETR